MSNEHDEHEAYDDVGTLLRPFEAAFNPIAKGEIKSCRNLDADLSSLVQRFEQHTSSHRLLADRPDGRHRIVADSDAKRHYFDNVLDPPVFYVDLAKVDLIERAKTRKLAATGPVNLAGDVRPTFADTRERSSIRDPAAGIKSNRCADSGPLHLLAEGEALSAVENIADRPTGFG